MRGYTYVRHSFFFSQIMSSRSRMPGLSYQGKSQNSDAYNSDDLDAAGDFPLEGILGQPIGLGSAQGQFSYENRDPRLSTGYGTLIVASEVLLALTSIEILTCLST